MPTKKQQFVAFTQIKALFFIGMVASLMFYFTRHTTMEGIANLSATIAGICTLAILAIYLWQVVFVTLPRELRHLYHSTKKNN